MKKKFPKISFCKILNGAKQVLENPLPFHDKNFKKLGDTFKANLGFGNSVIFTRDSNFVNYILKDNQKNYFKSRMQTEDLGKYIGKGLLTANGSYWLQQRRLIQPAFYKKKLEGVAKIISKVIHNHFLQIDTGKPLDIHPMMNDLAFSIVEKSLFSYTDTDGSMERFKEITKQVQFAVIKEIRQPYKKLWFQLSGSIKCTKTLANEARDILRKLITERQQSKKEHDDLLDLLLSSKYEDGTSMSIEQLIDEVLILFIAGHETTANALSFGIMLLSKHPEIQEKIYNEVKDINFESLAIMDSFQQCAYTKKCIDETLRLYPPAYFSDRVAITDDSYNDVKLPKGSTILISFYEIHRNKDIWDAPSEFIPERFTPEAKKTYANHYFPFGAGPRMCIGSNFALYEMITGLGQLIQHYNIYPEFESIEVRPVITLQPKNAFVRFEKRKN